MAPAQLPALMAGSAGSAPDLSLRLCKQDLEAAAGFQKKPDAGENWPDKGQHAGLHFAGPDATMDHRLALIEPQ
ncbi:MAG: hypothetical protein MUP33_03420 [Polaromonas sp.]|nr:hypothetical protein [Polaromonas sp.]